MSGGRTDHAVEHTTAKTQRELFDNASSMGELLDTVTLRGQIARFLHSHKDGEDKITVS